MAKRPTFRTLHVPRGPRLEDSAKLRRRCGQFFRSIDDASTQAAAKHTSMQMGPETELTHLNLGRWLEECSLTDFLEAVTHIYDGLPIDEMVSYAYVEKRNKGTFPKMKWLAFIQVAFDEENVGYKVRSDGAVTFYVDAEFERDREAAVVGLERLGLEAAKRDFDLAMVAMKNPTRRSHAIDYLFSAVENVFKSLGSQPFLKGKTALEFFEKSPPIGMGPGERGSTWANAEVVRRLD